MIVVFGDSQAPASQPFRAAHIFPALLRDITTWPARRWRPTARSTSWRADPRSGRVPGSPKGSVIAIFCGEMMRLPVVDSRDAGIIRAGVRDMTSSDGITLPLRHRRSRARVAALTRGAANLLFSVADASWWPWLVGGVACHRADGRAIGDSMGDGPQPLRADRRWHARTSPCECASCPQAGRRRARRRSSHDAWTAFTAAETRRDVNTAATAGSCDRREQLATNDAPGTVLLARRHLCSWTTPRARRRSGRGGHATETNR